MQLLQRRSFPGYAPTRRLLGTLGGHTVGKGRARLWLGTPVNSVALAGRAILVAEDEPLIALDIAETLRNAGASVFSARRLSEALRLADYPDLSVAVLDFALGKDDVGEVCERLNVREIPSVLYTGYPHEHEACQKGFHLLKPASREQLVGAVVGLLKTSPGEISAGEIRSIRFHLVVAAWSKARQIMRHLTGRWADT